QIGFKKQSFQHVDQDRRSGTFVGAVRLGFEQVQSLAEKSLCLVDGIPVQTLSSGQPKIMKGLIRARCERIMMREYFRHLAEPIGAPELDLLGHLEMKGSPGLAEQAFIKRITN